MECNVYRREDYGGFCRRYFAHIFDGIFLAIVYAVVSSILEDQIGILILVAMIFLTYMIGFEVYTGATPGFLILGMKIVAINGAEVTVKQVVVRLLSSFFSVLALGLGLIWVAIDANKQAWHDKAAGTYVIRSGANPVRTVEIPQNSLIRVRLSASMILAGLVFFVGFFGGIMHFLKSSDAYQLSEQYVEANPWIRPEVGRQIKFGLFPTGEVSVSNGSGEASFAIRVSGEKGKITVYTSLEKREGKWVIIKAGYKDKEGNFIDITSPYTSWNELNAKVRTLYQQGRHSEAAKVAEEALKVARNTFGPEHLNMALALNNLALLYHSEGRYAEAESLQKRALAIREKALIPDHPFVAQSLNNLAEIYRAQRKYAEAESLLRRVLAIREKSLGSDHPEVAAVCENMAELCRQIGKEDEAERLEARARKIRSNQ